MEMNPIVSDMKELLTEAVTDLQAKYTWYDIQGACAYAKCSRVTIMRAIKSGVLKSAKSPRGGTTGNSLCLLIH